MASGLYSGTVSFGYYNEASMTYLPFVAVTVSGADDIQLVYSVESGGSAGTLRISGVSEGDADIGRIAVETGDVVFGAGPDGSCSGTVAVRSAELILDGAHDVRVSAGVPDAVLSSEGLGGTVTVGGTASVGDMTIDHKLHAVHRHGVRHGENVGADFGVDAASYAEAEAVWKICAAEERPAGGVVRENE